MNGYTFDAGALIGLDRNNRDAIAMAARCHKNGWKIIVPATALAQAMRNPSSQAGLSTLLRRPTTDVIPLGTEDAKAVGKLLAQTGTKDIADAHVAICATRAKQPVLTSDPMDIHRLAPELQVIPL